MTVTLKHINIQKKLNSAIDALNLPLNYDFLVALIEYWSTYDSTVQRKCDILYFENPGSLRKSTELRQVAMFE